MSSFEPLFGSAGRRRHTPRSVAPVVADVWMPAQVGAAPPRVHSFLDASGDDIFNASDAAVREAEEAAAVHAQQAEIEAAYLRGLVEGREQGEVAERARLRGARQAAERALDDVRNGEARWLVNVEENVAAIAVAVAHQIVTREVATSTDIVLGIVARAVQEFGLDQALTIRINPNDLASLQSVERTESDSMADVAIGRELRWISDARVESGGCVVEGRERIVDGRVDTGLERLYRRLTHTNA
jgi:flagellar assembly protein FliH